MSKRGVYVGTFSDADIESGADIRAIAQKQRETGLQYTNSEIVTRHGKPIGLKVWVCGPEDVGI